MPLVQDLINAAASKLGVKGSGKQLSAEDVQLLWDNLNTLIDAMGAERQLSWTVKRWTYPLVVNQAQYSIGPTAPAPWTQPRPSTIQSWGLILPGSSPTQLEIWKRKVLRADEYGAIAIKGLPSPYPTKLYYDRAGDASSGNGNVFVYPVPNAGGYSIALYIPETIAPFYSLTQPVFGSAAPPTYGAAGSPTLTTYPPGYYKLLIYMLAAESAADFGRPIPPEVSAWITRTMSKIKARNIYVPEMVTSFPHGGLYDVYSDQIDSH